MTKEELLNGEFLKQFKDSKDFDNFMDTLYKRGVETMLLGEIEAHLGYSKSQKLLNPSNSRNGYGKKIIKTEQGEFDITVPRDRNAEFEPQIVPKRSGLATKHWTMPIHNWGLILNQFMTIFENRVQL